MSDLIYEMPYGDLQLPLIILPFLCLYLCIHLCVVLGSPNGEFQLINIKKEIFRTIFIFSYLHTEWMSEKDFYVSSEMDEDKMEQRKIDVKNYSGENLMLEALSINRKPIKPFFLLSIFWSNQKHKLVLYRNAERERINWLRLSKIDYFQSDLI